MASGSWSEPKRLKNYENAPKEKGIYEIGTYKNKKFNAKYVGRSKKNMRSRLSKHYNGRGNKGVAVYYEVHGERDNLYFRTKQVSDPKKAEAARLQKRSVSKGGYKWNLRIEN